MLSSTCGEQTKRAQQCSTYVKLLGMSTEKLNGGGRYLKAAVIAPTGLLKKYCTTGYHLALAHLMDDKEYVKFYRDAAERGEHVILDNSVIELGEPVDAPWLITACKKFRPTELVLADFPRQPDRTYEWAAHFGPMFKQAFPEVNLMVVPQWAHPGNVEEWLESYSSLAALEVVDSIGIPKFTKEMRPQICAMLHDMGVNDPTFVGHGVEHHLLGTWGNPVEIVELAKYRWIRGVDSKIPVRLGQLGIALHPHRGLLGDVRYDLPKLDFNNAIDPLPAISSHNCLTYQNWAEGVYACSDQWYGRELLPFERV